VDDPPGGQLAGDGGDGLARGQAAGVRARAQLAAGGQDGRAAAAVDGAVDAAAAGKLRIGRVDDRIDIERRDVGDDDFETGRRDF
jgi:hypothetical protein